MMVFCKERGGPGKAKKARREEQILRALQQAEWRKRVADIRCSSRATTLRGPISIRGSSLVPSSPGNGVADVALEVDQAVAQGVEVALIEQACDDGL